MDEQFNAEETRNATDVSKPVSVGPRGAGPHESTGPHERTESTGPHWPLATRIAFRFTFAYVLLFFGSYAAFFAPLTLPIAAASRTVWAVLTPWAAETLMGVPAPPLVSDGDGLAQWITFVGSAFGAAVVTVIWSIVDRRRANYTVLHRWLRVIVRYALGVAMVAYGLAKILHVQMPPPHLAKLVQPLGESSPTSLLWILMGSSAAYSAFTGAMELLGGVLLFNRRTTTLGALVSFASLGHVVALNLSYDVSVKIWSMNLMALSLVLIVPEARRLLNVFVLNRESEPVDYGGALFRNARTGRVAFRVGMVCLAITLGVRVIGLVNARARFYSRTPMALHGIYEVESFMSNGEAVPPALTEAGRWRTLVIERSGLASIRLMNDEVQDYLTMVDAANSTVAFVANPDTTVTTAGATRLAYDPRIIQDRFRQAVEVEGRASLTLGYSGPDAGSLTLRGWWGTDSLDVRMSRIDESEFLLLNRGFHWVQYYPFFR